MPEMSREEMISSLTELITQTVPAEVVEMLTAALQERDEAIRVAAEQRAELDELQRFADRDRKAALRAQGENERLRRELEALRARVTKAQRACADAVDGATTPEATQLPTRVLALLADPGTVHEVEVDDDGEPGDCIDDCAGCATDRGGPPSPFVPADQAFPEEP